MAIITIILTLLYLYACYLAFRNGAYVFSEEGSKSYIVAAFKPTLVVAASLFGAPLFVIILLALLLGWKPVFLTIEALLTRDKKRMDNVIDNHLDPLVDKLLTRLDKAFTKIDDFLFKQIDKEGK